MSRYPAVCADRFQLRPYREGDAERVLAIHSRLDVVRWLSNPPFHLMADRDEAIAWIERRSAQERDDPLRACRAIVPRGTDEVAGSVLVGPLSREDGAPESAYEIGWHLHPDAAGHGWATEAARVLARQAFAAGHEQLVVDMYPDNAPSAAVAQRLGAEDLGVRPDPWYGGESRMFLLRPEHVAIVES